jgi:hypothetical protein
VAQNLTDFGENALMDGTAMPTTLYVKWHIGDPGETGANNAAANTTRQSFTRTASSGGSASNAADILWTSVPNAETYSHVTIHDHVSAGNAWWYGPVTVAKAVAVGDDARIPAGDLDLQFL